MESNFKKQSKNRQRGQGMTEYIIIVALVAVAGIASYQIFGETVRNQLAGLGNQVAGQTAQGLADAKTAATANNTASNKTKGMGNYNDDNK